MTRRRTAMVVVLALASACSGASAGDVAIRRAAEVTTTVRPTTTARPTTTIPSTTTTTATAAASTAAPADPEVLGDDRGPPALVRTRRIVHDQPWTPFATVGGVVLQHPSARVERVGFHESGHDGARQLEPLPTAAAPITLETRDRGTGSRTAADVVVDPGVEIRAPATGRVKRAGTYVLYCDHSDDFVVIEPDARPGWEVKVLHIDGVLVRSGDRVDAGHTVLAPRPTQLPFESQVDERTAKPRWPHVHIEVVDPSIPDRPTGPGC